MTDIIVSKHEPGGYQSISEALEEAPSGARIVVKPGLYEEQIVLDKEVTIVGDGPVEEIRVRTSNLNVIVQNEDVFTELEGLTIELKRSKEELFCIYVEQGKIILNRCQISSEAGISVVGDSSSWILAQDCHIHSCHSNSLYLTQDASASLKNCTLSAGPEEPCVAISNTYFFQLRECQISGGSIGLWMTDGTEGAMIKQCDIQDSSKIAVVVDEGSDVEFEDCHIRDGKHGVYFSKKARSRMRNCKFTGYGPDPAVYIDQEAHPQLISCEVETGVYLTQSGRGLLQDCNIHGSDDQAAVAIMDGADPKLLNCRILNSANNGVYVSKGRGVLDQCLIQGFHASAGLTLTQGAETVVRRSRLEQSRFAVDADRGGKGKIFDTVMVESEVAVQVKGESDLALTRCQLSQGELGVGVNGNSRLLLDSCTLDHFGEDTLYIENSDVVMQGCHLSKGEENGVSLVGKSRLIGTKTKMEGFKREFVTSEDSEIQMD